jgi:hypothetical protein
MSSNRREREAAAEQKVRSVRAAAEAVVLATCVRIEDRQPGALVLSNMMAPKFQFDAAGRLLPVVAEINTMIEADSDPWAAASWWISADSYLGGRAPADLVGSDDKHRELRIAARRFLAPIY